MTKLAVRFLEIRKLQTATRLDIDKEGVATQVTKISFECKAPPSEIARLLFFQKRNQSLDAVIVSPQSELDLRMVPVKATESGALEETASES